MDRYGLMRNTEFKMADKTKLQSITNFNNKPIIFQNKPIDCDEKDIFDFSYQKKVLNVAIDADSRIVGIIGDYGTGKSSITKLLEDNRKKQGDKVININLWDQFNKKIENQDDKIEKVNDGDVVSQSLMKSFLYQLAFANDLKNIGFAKYINARFNKNNGRIGFSVATKKSFFILCVAALWFILYFFIESFGIKSDVLTDFIKLKSIDCYQRFIYSFFILRYLFLSLGIAFLLWAVIWAAPVFTSWKSEGVYIPGNSDIYEIYLLILQKLKKSVKKKKCIILIDDLDRTADKDVVVTFLKEIYRCIHLIPEEIQKHFVFLVSLKAESMLNLLSEEEHNTDFKNVYSKIFDYTLNIKQIHHENYRDVVLGLLEQEKESIEHLFKTVIPKTDTGQKTVVEFFLYKLKWIYSDENVTIRELKERLNETFLLYQTLLARQYEETTVDLGKCAAVIFLKRKYEKEYHEILGREKEFATLIRNCNKHRYDDTILNKTISESNIFKDKKIEAPLSEMIRTGIIEDDFSMYFYSYPKNSYIKNLVEKEVFDALIHGNRAFLENREENDKIRYVIEEKSGKVIDEAVQNYLSNVFPLFVVNEIIFVYVINKFPNEKKRFIELLYKEAQNFIIDPPNTGTIILYILNYQENVRAEFVSVIQEGFIIQQKKLTTLANLVKIWEKIIRLFSSNLSQLICVFTDERLPLFPKEFFIQLQNQEFQALIVKNLSEKKLSEFDKFCLTELNNENIERYLYEKQKIISLLLSYATQDRLSDFDFTSDWVSDKLIEIANDLYQYDADVFVKIRTIAKSNLRTCSKEFYRIYNDPYPIITETELNQLSTDELYPYVNHSLITIENCKMLSNYCNFKKLKGDSLYSFFTSCFMEEYKLSDPKVMRDIIKNIDFKNAILFKSLRSEQIKEVMTVFQNIFDANTIAGAFELMRTFHFLWEDFEKQFSEEIKNDNANFDHYLELLNELECASDISVDILSSNSVSIGLHPNITERLLQKEAYTQYIIGKTLYDQFLTYNTRIPLDMYFTVFKSSNECFEYFEQNKEILEAFFDNKKYKDTDLTPERLVVFYHMRQPIDLIKTILTKLSGNEAKQKEYLFHMSDIDTEGDARDFIELITREQFVYLLKDSDLFYYLWHKMWTSGQKRQFTKKVNKILSEHYGQ